MGKYNLRIVTDGREEWDGEKEDALKDIVVETSMYEVEVTEQ